MGLIIFLIKKNSSVAPAFVDDPAVEDGLFVIEEGEELNEEPQGDDGLNPFPQTQEANVHDPAQYI